MTDVAVHRTVCPGCHQTVTHLVRLRCAPWPMCWRVRVTAPASVNAICSVTFAVG